jgi:hypothetical protein
VLLKLAQEVVYGKQKVFLADSKYILRSSFWPFKSRNTAYEKVKKLNQLNEAVLILKNIEYFLTYARYLKN